MDRLARLSLANSHRSDFDQTHRNLLWILVKFFLFTKIQTLVAELQGTQHKIKFDVAKKHVFDLNILLNTSVISCSFNGAL